MKSIQPFTIWKDGQTLTANVLKLVSQDDLSGSANFYFELIDQQSTPGPTPEDDPSITNTVIINGNVPLQGVEYENWDDSNDQAYVIIAGKLGVTII